MTTLIIEGIDGVGKTSLCESIKKAIGWVPVIKYEKPVKSNNFLPIEYQKKSFDDGFRIAGTREFLDHLIFDRFHLGECVYSPLYRKYSGDYVFQVEAKYLERYKTLQENLSMVLLVTERFDHLKDDGQSFDRSKVKQEQELFKSAFERSWIRKKAIVRVDTPDGKWRDPGDILKEMAEHWIIPKFWLTAYERSL